MQDKIKKIYEVIANKELSFGCLGKINGRKVTISHQNITEYHGDNYIYYHHEDYLRDCVEGEIKIIGHPVMIGDCLDWWKGLGINMEGCEVSIQESLDCDFIFFYWKKLRLPIEEQSEECIDYIFNLIK